MSYHSAKSASRVTHTRLIASRSKAFLIFCMAALCSDRAFWFLDLDLDMGEHLLLVVEQAGVDLNRQPQAAVGVVAGDLLGRHQVAGVVVDVHRAAREPDLA